MTLAAIACGTDADPGLNRGSTVVVGTRQTALRPDETNADFLPFSSLTQVGPAGEEVPRLATRWVDSADGRVRTWHLRSDVRWHDGEPFTAHDVKFTLDLLAQHGYVLGDVTVLTDSTVRVEVARHDYGADVVYYPRHLLEDEDPSRFLDWDFWNQPIGTGPFRYVRGDPQRFMELKANPDYYRGKPRIDRVIVKYVGEAAISDALAGNIDIIYEADPRNWSQLEPDGRFKAHHGIYPSGYALYFNHRHPLFGDARVRRAVAHAIDRQAILETVDLRGDLPLSDALWTRRQFRKGELADPLPYDPEEAVRLLDAAGWMDTDGDGVRDREGVPARFTLTPRPDSRTRAVLVQEHLRRVGIEAELEQLDVTLVWERVESKQYDAAIHVLQAHQPWHNQYFGEGGLTGYENPDVARILRQAMETSNLDLLDSLYLEMRDDFLRDIPFVLLQPFNYSHFVHRRIQGLSGSVLMDPMEQMDELWTEDERELATTVSGIRPDAAADGSAGTLRILYAADERSLDPAMEDVPRFLFSSPLVRYEGGIQECGKPQPLLAESWEHSSDYQVWTIRLRPEAEWHDGVPVRRSDTGRPARSIRSWLEMSGRPSSTSSVRRANS
jgi:peptide/nickel transport system substrate-binding protein